MEDKLGSIPLRPVSSVSEGTRSQSSRSKEHPHDSAPSLNRIQPEEFKDFVAHFSLSRRSIYGVSVTIIYTAFALSSWIILCILSFRLISTYNDSFVPLDEVSWANSIYLRNEKWYHAARVLQAIAGVLALPVTASVCASATIIYTHRQNQSLTMQQVISLADTQLRHCFRPGTWKKHGSPFLLLATLLLSLLGLIIAPFQAIFISTDTIKTPTKTQKIYYLMDLTDQPRLEASDNLITVMTRNALKSTTITEPQAQLWMGASASCNPLSEGYPQPNYTWSYGIQDACASMRNTLSNMPALPDPFLAELSSEFNTGLFRQFAPRINSTAQYDSITADQFPADCDQVDGGFFAEYANTTDLRLDSFWGVQACMPDDITQSPWKATRDRQDFTEVLYLNITLSEDYSSGRSSPAYYRLTLNTTAGYFELPNYMNGGVAGPLLDKYSTGPCGSDCGNQGSIHPSNTYINNERSRREATISTPSDRFSIIHDKGPLLTIALALFGEGSFITSRARYQSAYASTTPDSFKSPSDSYIPLACIDTLPLGPFIDYYSGRGSINKCIANRDGGVQGWNVDEQVADWLSNFNYSNELMSMAFTAAAFLANKEWLRQRIEYPGDRTLTISYDMGSDVKVPAISLAGVTLVSTLLGIQVLGLLALGIYSTYSVW
ncbi:hypothetical protein BDW72DRAFT_214052 [Aspergillus terricola var. indicus]